ncbi:MAG TPA: hypothetical protein VE931_08730 [Pyrinomonadaceae bacterium]|nr:hypothetical protein [Pyrinomonadaceae bacterium]
MNYFNYFTEIEDAFVRRRGKHLFLSPMDWALMETWKQQGIPLHIVLRGVEKSFDSYEARPRKRTVKTLLYCQEEVEAQYAEWVEARVGSSSASAEAESDKTPFSFAAISEHLQRTRNALSELAQSRNDDLSEALTRAVALLVEIEKDFASGATLDTRKLEDSLTGLERMLNDSMLSVAAASTLDEFKKGVKDQLKPYRAQMDAAAYKQTFDNLLLKRLREQFAIPRLSLFFV